MSVINQMLRDLQARGEPLDIQEIHTPTADRTQATAAAGHTPRNTSHTPHTPPGPLPTRAHVSAAISTAHDTRKSQRTRRLAWGFTACAVVGVLIGLQWQEHQVRQARKLRPPLGYAQFNGAIDPNTQTLAPALPAQVIHPQPVAPSPSAATPTTPTTPSTPPTLSASAPEAGSSPAPSQPLSKAKTERGDDARQTQTPRPAVVQTVSPPATPSIPATARSPQEHPTRTRTPIPTVVNVSAAPTHDPEQMLVRAADLIARGRHVDAAAQLNKVLEARPEHVDARRALAALQVEANQPEAALATLLQGVAIAPGRFAPMAATLQAELGDTQGALATMSRIPPEAQTPSHHALAAGIAQRLGQYQAAAAAYQRALAEQPNEPAWWIGLGISLEALDQHAQARTAYERATALPQLSAELREFAAQRLRSPTPRSKSRSDSHE